MTLLEFLNAAKILHSLDFPDLVDAGVMKAGDIADRWQEFRRRPIEYLIRADDRTAAAIWRLVEARMR